MYPKGGAGWALVLSAVFLSSSVSAQTSTSTSSSTELSEEELQLLQQEFGGDASGDDGQPQIQLPTMQAPVSGMFQAMSAAFASTNPEIALILDTALAYFSDEPQQLGAHDPNHTGFTLQQLEMHIEANVDPFFHLNANLVFSQFGVEVEEAFLSSLAFPYGLKLRAGQFLTRFGRINATHPHSWNFADQPITNGKFFGGEGSRGLGAELSWLAPTPWFAELVVSANEAVGVCCARTFYGSDDLGINGIEDFLYTAALKQFFPFNDDLSLLLGLSGQFGPNSSGNGNRSELYGYDLYLRYRPVDSELRRSLTLQSEGMFRSRQYPGRVIQDVGIYSQLVFHANLNWEFGLRQEWVSGAENDPLDPEWFEERHRYSVQATYYPSHFSRFRAQGNLDFIPGRSEPMWGAILAVEVLIGAHGAHEF